MLDSRGGFANVQLDSTNEHVPDIPLDTLSPIRPNSSGENCFRTSSSPSLGMYGDTDLMDAIQY